MAYKILWFSIPSLHDTTNGAAIHNKVLLEALAARGIQVRVLNALVADDVRGLACFERIAALLHDTPQRKFLQFNENGVEYVVLKTKGHLAPDVTTADQGRLFEIFMQLLERFQPDVVMGYSPDLFSCAMRHEAKYRGIPIVYALCNGLHRSFAFPDCDLIFSPSEATAKLYREGDGTDVKAVGQFIDRARVTVDPKKREPKYITLVNPAPEKGLAIFVKLAQAYNKKHPEQRFLVVKSVGNYQRCLSGLHYANGERFFSSHESNPIPMIDVAEHVDDIRLVYAVTKVVITPSVWHESWGCVATEAIYNNIPVLSSKSGGLPEAVREGGILLDAPACTQADFNCVPSDEEIAPWVEALERLVNEDWTEKCQQASAHNDLQSSVDRLMVYLEPLLSQGQKTKAPLERSGFYCDNAMKARRLAYARQQQQAHDSTAAAAPAATTAAKAADTASSASPEADAQPKESDSDAGAKSNKAAAAKDKDKSQAQAQAKAKSNSSSDNKNRKKAAPAKAKAQDANAASGSASSAATPAAASGSGAAQNSNKNRPKSAGAGTKKAKSTSSSSSAKKTSAASGATSSTSSGSKSSSRKNNKQRPAKVGGSTATSSN